ncbi:hypothetical protein N7478_002868 [Penicillium angulare]|uniref:uncharacterized protein n=1 Tax=Penicillium angulare TaxID=116970 RepID=UPI0025422FC7|nr:uncharacterized protein N7478_002868 [Penicillium angulare]KAJ5287182.1 hypothetical protein N7478_002868 [Penicillium angulare]
MSDFKAALHSKRWVGFDLDDTLHEFRRASSQASEHVFQLIGSAEEIDPAALRTTYQHILSTTTANAFTDGRSSTEYRRERFSQLLQAHGVADADDNIMLDTTPDPDDFLSKTTVLLGAYNSSLESNLSLKPGVVKLFHTLRGLGKKIVVITEGPADAQEWTVQKLGLNSYIDVLITTNEVGKSKVDGLFDVVLEKYGIGNENIVYFGDNEVRDVKAASKSGILAVLYDEKRNSELYDLKNLRISSWENLQKIILEDDGKSD